MKILRTTAVVLCITLILSLLPGSIYAFSPVVTVTLNGEKMDFPDQQPLIVDDRTLVPMRAIFNALGAEIEWNQDTQTVTALNGDTAITLTIDSNTAYKNGQPFDLDVPAQIIGDRTMVPLRFVGEAMDCSVDWEPSGYIVIITATYLIPPELANDELIAALPNGTSLIPDDALFNTYLIGETDATKTKVSVDDKSLPFKEAMRFTINNEAEALYSIQVAMRTIAPILKNDMLLATFYARGISTTDTDDNMVRMSVVFESSTDFEKSIIYEIELEPGGEWQQFYIPFASVDSYDTEGAQFNIRLGYKPEVLEIGGLALTNYGQSLTLRDMPKTRLTYAGREDDAQWRKDAFARIEQIRKSDIEVKVIGAGGTAVEGAEVHVTMSRSAFAWGTAIGYPYLNGDNALSQRMREMLVKYFNTATVENALKWPTFENNRGNAVRAVNKVIELGLTPRGHTMVWDNFDVHMPPRMATYSDNPTELQNQTLAHITEMGTLFKGMLSDWDVLNETVDNRAMRNILGDKAVAEWFILAKNIDPDVKIYINEYNFKPAFTEALNTFRQYGAPIDGIGIQSHYSNPTNPQKILSQMDAMAELASEIKLSEYDFDTDDAQLQADFTRDIIIAAYSHPACNGFIMWGFWDGAHWNNNAPLFYKDWRIKPSGQAYEDLVLGTFRTDESGTSGKDGRYNTRGFHGEYLVTVTYQGKEYMQEITLEDGKTSTLTFDISKEPVPLAPKPEPKQIALP